MAEQLEKKIDFTLKICDGHKNPISERCKNCVADYNIKKYPNNYNCPDRKLKDIAEGICIEHIRYIARLKTAKKECATCTSTFENSECDCYNSFPSIKYEEVVKEIEKRNLKPMLKDVENIKKYVMLMNIGILKSGKKEKISYDKIIDGLQFFLNEKRIVDSSVKRVQKN